MSKSFTTIPRPAAPSADAIARFERGGIGQDTKGHQDHIPSNVEKLEPVPAAKADDTRRLSIDLPKSLHVRFKAACAGNDRKMIDELMVFIGRRTTELEAELEVKKRA